MNGIYNEFIKAIEKHCKKILKILCVTHLSGCIRAISGIG